MVYFTKKECALLDRWVAKPLIVVAAVLVAALLVVAAVMVFKIHTITA